MKLQSSIIFSKKLAYDNDPSLVLEYLIDMLNGLSCRVSSGDKVLIKPNFVAPFEKATTDLRFIDFFITKIRQLGAIPVIGESSGFEFDTDTTFEILGVREFAEDRKVELINFEKENFIKVNLGNGLGAVEIASAAIEARLIINLPVLKGHTITKVTGAVKNLFGFLSKPSRRSLHCKRLEDGIAALARKFDKAIHFVDARCLLTRAVFGEIQPLDYCIAGLDPFALDHFGSKLLGINPESIKYLEGTREYKVEGAMPDESPVFTDKSSLKERFHRVLYSAFYWLDDIKCSTLGGNSVLPLLHWYLGIHPKIGKVTSEELKHLASLCQIGAISVDEGRIIKEKCIKARCLRCYREAKSGMIVLKGFNPPQERVRND